MWKLSLREHAHGTYRKMKFIVEILPFGRMLTHRPHLPAFPLPINKSISLLPSSPLPHSSLHHILSSTLLYLYPVVHPSFSPYLFAHQIPTMLFIWVCTRYLLGSNDTGGILIGRPRVNSIGVTTHIQSWNGPHNDRSSAPTVTGLLHVTLICVQPLSSVLP